MGKAAAKAEFGLWERDVVYTLRQWIIQMQNWLKASTHAAVTWICSLAKVDFFFLEKHKHLWALLLYRQYLLSRSTPQTLLQLWLMLDTQLPTIMSQHWRKFTTKEEHLSKLSGNKADVVLPHEICLVIRHKCMCVLYFIFRQVVHGSESDPLPWHDSRSDSLSAFALPTIKLHFRCLDGICNLSRRGVCKLAWRKLK